MIKQDKIDLANEFGISFDEYNNQGVLTYTLHMTVAFGTTNQFLLCWLPPGEYRDNAFYRNFPKLRPSSDEPNVDDREILWSNWEAAF